MARPPAKEWSAAKENRCSIPSPPHPKHPPPATTPPTTATRRRRWGGDEPRVAGAIGEMFLLSEDHKARREFERKAVEGFADLLMDVAANFVAAKESPHCAKYDTPGWRMAGMLERVARECGIVKDEEERFSFD